jgi:hypothetical protein
MNSFKFTIKFQQHAWRLLATAASSSMFGCLHTLPSHDSKFDYSSTGDEVQVLPKLNRGAWIEEFSENFNEVEVDTEPETLFILDGAYSVQLDHEGQKSLKLPGSPVGDFGLLFGPRIRDKALELRFSFFSSKMGRRMPSIAAGIGGVRGYRLRLNPAAKDLILSYEDQNLRTLPFSWSGDQWWSVRFQVIPKDLNKTTLVQYKLWPSQESEPDNWLVSDKFDIEYKGGKCALWGFPYASTPILFDNISIMSR